MKTLFYLRCGDRISRARVKASKKAHAETYRTGEGIAGKGSRQINHNIADRIDEMSEEEFCREYGAFTCRIKP